MKVRASAHISVYLLRFALCFGIFCTLCSACAALGAFYPYGGAFQWWKLLSEDLQQGILYLDGTGFAFSFFGFFMISILSLLAFAFSLIGYRRNKIGKKPMMWAMILLGVAVLVLVGSLMIARSSCTEDTGGSDDTLYCTFSLSPAITLPWF